MLVHAWKLTSLWVFRHFQEDFLPKNGWRFTLVMGKRRTVFRVEIMRKTHNWESSGGMFPWVKIFFCDDIMNKKKQVAIGMTFSCAKMYSCIGLHYYTTWESVTVTSPWEHSWTSLRSPVKSEAYLKVMLNAVWVNFWLSYWECCHSGSLV